MEKARILSASLQLLNVRKQEGKPVMLLFLHHFTLGVGLALFYTVANVLFLSNYDISLLPYAYLLAAVVMIFSSKIYEYLEHNFRITQSYTLAIVLVLISVILFWLGLQLAAYLWLIFIMFAWYRSILLISNLEFWGVSSNIFDIRQSKRLFSLISAGDIPAKLLGYLSVTALVPFVGTENLLIISILAFAASIYILQRIIKLEGVADLLRPHESDNIYEIKTAGFANRFFRSNLVKALCYLSLWGSLAFMILNYAFLHEVQARFKTEAELAQFFGLFYSIGNAVILLSKLFLTGRVVNRIGIKVALAITPLLLMVFSFYILLTGVDDNLKIIWIFMIMMLLGEIIQYALYYPVFLALFQPLKKTVKAMAHIITKGIFEPIGLFIAGIALIIVFNFIEKNNLYIINLVLLFSLIGWLGAVVYTGVQYLGSLKDAVKQRFVEGTELGIRERQYEHILEQKLNSDYAEEVIYALQMLEKTRKKEYHNYLFQVLNHPDDDVVIYAIDKAGEYRLKEIMPVLNEKLSANDVHPKVKAKAIKTFCMINLADTDPIVPFIDSGDYEIKSAAVVNLLKYGGLDAIMAAGKELENLMHGDVHDKITAAQILGELKNAQLFKLLVKLLKDESTKVQDAALIACRNVKHPVLLSFLLGMVNSGNYNSRLKAAIQANGEDAANEISSLLPKEQDRYKIIFLVQVLSGIKSNYSEKGLLAMLNYTDVEVNEKVLIALFNIQFNNKNYESQIKPYINEHLDKAEWIYSSLPYLMNDVLVKNALLNELNKVVKSLLYHFSFIYDRASVKKALAGFDSNNRVKRADALEILDTLLPGDLFNRFNWIAGSRTIDEKIHHFSNSYLNNSHEILTYILKKGEKEFHPWTITTAIHALEIESISEHIKEKYTHYHLDSVRKIFRHKISKSKENNYTTITMVHNDQHLSQVERVLLLKSTSLFADTPDTVLAEIAGIVKEVRIGSDTRIFEKDDDGDCMYIIYEGEVSIHDGAHEYALLKNRDFFGELALLDSEPRSTAATAKKETLLLRIDQYDFLELISDRSEVAKGILTILSQRIRRQNELIKELKARLHDNL